MSKAENKTETEVVEMQNEAKPIPKGIYKKIQQIKVNILQKALKKSGYNKFSNFSYYELADILPEIIQECTEYNLFTHINFEENKAILTILDIDDGSTITYESPTKDIEIKGANAIQALGGVQTYMRRYLYVNCFDICENDFFDGNPPSANEPKEPVEPDVTDEKISDNQRQALFMVASNNAEAIKSAMARYGYKNTADIKNKDYKAILEIISKIVKKEE